MRSIWNLEPTFFEKIIFKGCILVLLEATLLGMNIGQATTGTGWQNQYHITKSICTSTNATKQPESSISCTTTGNQSKLTTTWTDDTSIHPFKPKAKQWIQPLKNLKTFQQTTQQPSKPDKTIKKTSRRKAQRRAKCHTKRVAKKANLPFVSIQVYSGHSSSILKET
jgi:hypothetical protein